MSEVREKWEFGVPVMHGNPNLRAAFYATLKDCEGHIVDIYVNDIIQVLKHFGYKVDVYMPPGESTIGGADKTKPWPPASHAITWDPSGRNNESTS